MLFITVWFCSSFAIYFSLLSKNTTLVVDAFGLNLHTRVSIDYAREDLCKCLPKSLLTTTSTSSTTFSSIKKFSRRNTCTSSRQTTVLFQWNPLSFFAKREGDFIKLEQSNDRIGPGPILFAVNLSPEIETEELYDMIFDSCTPRTYQNCKIYRIDDFNPYLNDEYIDRNYHEINLSVRDLMQKIASGQLEQKAFDRTQQGLSYSSLLQRQNLLNASESTFTNKVSVLFFSGFTNKDMMALYNVLTHEIYQEYQHQTMGTDTTLQKFVPPACAKVVPNSLDKPMKQVLREICGDHTDAIGGNTSS